MPDYKEMYLKIFRASEQAVNILITAQRECEELTISLPESEVRTISLLREDKRARMGNNFTIAY